MKIDWKEWYGWKAVVLFVLLGALSMYLFFTYLPIFSSFGVAIMLVFAGLAVLLVVDKYIFKRIDTIEQLTKGNLAYVAFIGIIAWLIIELTKIGLGN